VLKKDRIEYDPDIPRWFVYLTHLFNKAVFCHWHGHRRTVWASCDRCGEYV
jgi:primosomal protein N'